MKKSILALAALPFLVIGCERADEPIDQVSEQTQESINNSGSAIANSTTNATANPELETNTRFNFISAESYHIEARDESDKEDRLSGSSTETPGRDPGNK